MALFAMLFQILFAMEQASARAAAAANGGADGSPMGFLEICTANGILRITAPVGSGLDEQPAPRSGGGESCAVCEIAAVSDATDTSVTGRVESYPPRHRAANVSVFHIDIPPSRSRRSGTTRGPPACQASGQ